MKKKTKPAVHEEAKLCYLRVDEVPCEFREPFIHTGYRIPNCSFRTCIKSLFCMNNNETINFWTHFFPFLFFLHELVNLCVHFNYCNFFLPLFLYLTTTCFYLLMSSVAHALNCMSPIARHVCFIMDYLCISICGIGCSIAYNAYTIKNIKFQLNRQISFDYYVLFAMVLCSISNVMSCASRFVISSSKRGILRLTPFVCQYIFINIPLAYKFISSYQPENIDKLDYVVSFLSSPPTAVIATGREYQTNITYHNSTVLVRNLELLTYNGSLNYVQGVFTSMFDFKMQSESDFYYLMHIGAAIVSMLLYVFHVPERIYPGKFDIIGQSHQIFHLFAFVCSYSQFIALKTDMKKLLLSESFREFDFKSLSLQTILDSNVTFLLICCLILNSFIFVYYYLKAVYNNPWQSLNSFSSGLKGHEKVN